MKAIVILNAAAGSIAGASGTTVADQVEAGFRKRGIDAEIVAVEHSALVATLKKAIATDADVIVVGGGDGTLNTGASALMGTDKALGVLPLGTLNHFAKDLGIPLDIDAAIDVVAQGHLTLIDVGEVNGHIFLNNSSIGLYPTAVDERNELRHRHGGGKAHAMFNACLDVMRRFPLLDVTLEGEGRSVDLRVPFVFVGNNRYEMSLLSLGKRLSLQGGELGLYFTQNRGRFGILRLAFRALVGRMKQDRDFRYIALQRVEIRTKRRAVRVSLDGEVVRMTSPIRYAIHPKALRVVAPAADVAAPEKAA